MNHPMSSQHIPSIPPTTLEQRRQVALQVAEECDRLLRNQFGATSVTVFGSLANQSPWHWESDIDLAVNGLSFERWLDAVEAVRAIAPDWLSVDLVRLETLHPAVYRHVIQECIKDKNKLSDNTFLILKDHLDDEVRALDRCIAELVPAIDRAKERMDSYDVRALASYINDFYRSCERMSERVAVALDGGLPRGKNWHQALLRQVAESGTKDGKEIRPPLWSGALLFDIDEYRRFRHLVHHKYGDELRPDYVRGLAELAPQVAPKIKEAIARFNQWLMEEAG
jgi:predicted nucleotidyltransferase